MVSADIQKQVKDIQEQSFKRLRELSILVFLITTAFFFDYRFSDWWIARPMALNPRNYDWVVGIALGYDIEILAVSLAFLIGIVSYFWWLRNTPKFHVLFIKPKQYQKQNNDTRFFTWDLLPVVGITCGLIAFTIYDRIMSKLGYSGYTWYAPPNGVYLFRPLITWVCEPLIPVVCSCALLYFIYRIKPERVQRNLHWFLLIPIILSNLSAFCAIYYNAHDYYLAILNHNAPTVGTGAFMSDVVYFSYVTFFWASFVLLFYIVYHTNAERGKSCTFAEGEQLQDFIQEGVGILPKKVHVSDSYSIPLDLTLSECFTSGYYHYASGCHYKRLSNDYLEAEIQAVGLEVDGEKRVRIYEASQMPMTSQMPAATWNCRFAESGTHAVNLMIHLIRPSNTSRRLIFTHAHDVEVNSFVGVSLLPAFTLIIPILVVVVQALLRVIVK